MISVKVLGRPGQWRIVTESGLEVRLSDDALDVQTLRVAVLLAELGERIARLEQRVDRLEKETQKIITELEKRGLMNA